MPGEGPGERSGVVETHGDCDLEDGTVRLGQQGHGTKHTSAEQVASPRHAQVSAEDAAQRSFRDPDRAGHVTERDVAEVSASVIGGRGDNRIARGRQVQRPLVIQRFRDHAPERLEERVCFHPRLGTRDRPPYRVEHHLAKQRGDGDNPDPVPGHRDESWVKEHREGLHAGVQRRLMMQARRDPRRLMGWQQVVAGLRLDLNHPAAGVLDLVHVVKVPAGDQLLAAVIEEAAPGPAAIFPQVHQASGGRLNLIFGRIRRDGHTQEAYSRF